MRISFVLPSLPRQISGGTKVVFEYANFLADNNDITIYYMVDKCLNKYPVPKSLRRKFGRIVAPIYPRWIKLSSKVHVKGVYSKDQVECGDVVIATAIRTSYFVKSLNDNCGKKAYFIQDFENWSFSDEEVYASYRFGMANIVIAKWLKDIVEKKSGNKAFYVSNGINEDVFFEQNPIETRNLHTITFHYRSEPIKGCTYAIEVIKKIKQVYKDTEVFVIGREKRPDSLPQWCNYIENASAKEVAAINNKATIFLCTSVSEGFGLPGLEAMSCGCALVTTDYSGAMEYAVDGKNALVSATKDVNGLANNIIRLFSDNELLYKISREAINTGKNHSFQISAAKFQNILTEICKIGG